MEHFNSTVFGLALIIFAAAFGISRIAQSAMEAMSRQPEISSKIQTAMIVVAALIEGATLFAIVVAWLS
ncbi:ATP synthase F0 subunit C [Alkalitalea saponilacus]|uniref:ATP synthase F(0) sector subunit c n=1 Tax=Alkalitalea saponilacus TaxID=889453 RepID=A0A1T5EER0_9BACT|nr:ATP synthase F0 subunit C [Alkalitalea saponilacus]ASB49006.1 F0F1 ATP synthase subunit C [Alkalitalea saponilacus]SKB82433.1 F-type H+-transporting ATPase subunit c [Alkalitalea saponilacus]